MRAALCPRHHGHQSLQDRAKAELGKPRSSEQVVATALGRLDKGRSLVVDGLKNSLLSHGPAAHSAAGSRPSARGRGGGSANYFFPVYATRYTVPAPSSVTTERAVLRHAYAHRPPPHVAFRGDEADKKVLELAGCLAFVHRHADDLVADAACPVPRAMLAGEGVVVILRGNCWPS